MMATTQPTLPELLHESLTNIFSRWTALSLCGEDPTLLIEETLDFLIENPDTTIDVLEANFDNYFTHLCVSVEDGSCLQVAGIVIKLYKELLEGKKDLYEFVKSRKSVNTGSSQFVGSESSEDDEEDNNENETDIPMAVEIDGNEMEIDQNQDQQPLVDEDGFQLVTRKKGRKRQ